MGGAEIDCWGGPSGDGPFTRNIAGLNIASVAKAPLAPRKGEALPSDRVSPQPSSLQSCRPGNPPPGLPPSLFASSNSAWKLDPQRVDELCRKRLEAIRKGMQFIRPIAGCEQALRIDQNEVAGRIVGKADHEVLECHERAANNRCTLCDIRPAAIVE